VTFTTPALRLTVPAPTAVLVVDRAQHERAVIAARARAAVPMRRIRMPAVRRCGRRSGPSVGPRGPRVRPARLAGAGELGANPVARNPKSTVRVLRPRLQQCGIGQTATQTVPDHPAYRTVAAVRWPRVVGTYPVILAPHRRRPLPEHLPGDGRRPGDPGSVANEVRGRAFGDVRTTQPWVLSLSGRVRAARLWLEGTDNRGVTSGFFYPERPADARIGGGRVVGSSGRLKRERALLFADHGAVAATRPISAAQASRPASVRCRLIQRAARCRGRAQRAAKRLPAQGGGRRAHVHCGVRSRAAETRVRCGTRHGRPLPAG
jgi:hypothetical protein